MRKKEWKEWILSWIYPRRCPVCEEIVVYPAKICPDCRRKLPYIREPLCKCCGKELLEKDGELCYDCSRRKKTFRAGISLFRYREAKEPVLALKYRGKKEYADFFAEEFALRKGTALKAMRPDGIIPVPMYDRKKRKRGYNQAELLAKKVGDMLEIPVYPKALRRIRSTAAQKELNQSQRIRNLEQAFAAGDVTGLKKVVLFDDIYTTGATAEACSRVLKRAGVEEIHVATIAIGAGQ